MNLFSSYVTLIVRALASYDPTYWPIDKIEIEPYAIDRETRAPYGIRITLGRLLSYAESDEGIMQITSTRIDMAALGAYRGDPAELIGHTVRQAVDQLFPPRSAP